MGRNPLAAKNGIKLQNQGILYVNSGGACRLPTAETLLSVSDGGQVTSVTDTNAAKALIDRSLNPAIMISNTADLDLFRTCREKHPDTRIILVTSFPMRAYSTALEGEEDLLVDHVIASRGTSFRLVDELRVTIAKIRQGDVFGISKYLMPGTTVHQATVKGSPDRDRLNNEVMEFAERCRLGQHTAKIAFGITEELLMNTIHDAPVAAGLLHYANLPRTRPLLLRPEEYGELQYGCDGRILAISSSDPFGCLEKDKLFQYLKKVLKRNDSSGLIDTKKGGAGLGFFKILYSSHGLVCNVRRGERTEIMALIEVGEQLRDFANMPRSIHYFKVA